MNCSFVVIGIDVWQKKMTKSSVDIHDVDYAGWKCDINWNHLIEDGETNCSNEMFLSLDSMFRLRNNVIISFNNKISLLVHLKYIKPTNDLYTVKKTSDMRKSCTYTMSSQTADHIFCCQKLSEINWSKTDTIELISWSNNT